MYMGATIIDKERMMDGRPVKMKMVRKMAYLKHSSKHTL